MKTIVKARPRQKLSNVDFRFYSCSWKEMDRKWNTTITRSQVLWSVKSHDPIATTWSISPSRKRRSNPLQWHHRRVQEEEVRQWFAMVIWRLDINSGKRMRSEKRFQYYVNPNSSNQFLYFRVIQGHSRDNAVDPTWQDNVLLPKRFTEYIYHVGNATDLNSLIRNGYFSGGTSLKRERQAVFFTTVNPMEDVHDIRWNPIQSYENKDRAMQEYLETPSKYAILVKFEARSREILENLPNTVTCSRSL